MQKTIQLSLLSVALLSQLNAKDITLAPLEVTSTAIKTDELKSTDAVEVYTAKDIEKAHVQNIYEFLNQQTSVITMPSYGNPFTQKIDMHGYGIGTGYQNIVVTINGRKMNNIDMVPQLLSSIAPSSIKKIEIIKSSGIVMGGDGANAGVINITTKNSNDKEFSFYMGNYGLVDGSFYLGYSDEKLSLNATGETQKSDGTRDINNAGDRDKNSQTTGSFDLTYTPIEKLELRLGASFSRASILYAGSLTKKEYDENPQQVGSKTPSKQNYDTNVVNAGISYYLSDNLSLNFNASHEKKSSPYELLYTTADVYNSDADYTYNSTRTTLEYEENHFSFITGIDSFYGKRDSSYSGVYFGFPYSGASIVDKNNLAAFAMAKYSFGANTIKAGYRYEKVTYKYTAPGATSLKDNHKLNGIELGYNYTLNKKQSLFASYSHSYQAPDIDRFFSNGQFNHFIDPMKANNYTIGYNNIQANNKFKLSVYYIDLKDEIYYYKDLINVWPTPSQSKNTNIDKSHKYGLDLYDKYLITQKFNIALNYNYVQAIIDQEIQNGENYAGKELPGVSNHNVKATFNYLPNKHATLSLTEVYRSQAYAADDFNNKLSQKQDAYYSTDVAATYATKKWEIFAKINNLFNQSNGLWIRNDAIYPVNFTTTAMVGFKLKY